MSAFQNDRIGGRRKYSFGSFEHLKGLSRPKFTYISADSQNIVSSEKKIRRRKGNNNFGFDGSTNLPSVTTTQTFNYRSKRKQNLGSNDS